MLIIQMVKHCTKRKGGWQKAWHNRKTTLVKTKLLLVLLMELKIEGVDLDGVVAFLPGGDRQAIKDTKNY